MPLIFKQWCNADAKWNFMLVSRFNINLGYNGFMAWNENEF